MARNEKLTELELLERQMRQTFKVANDSAGLIEKKYNKMAKVSAKLIEDFERISKYQVEYIGNQSKELMKEQKKRFYTNMAAVSGWTIIITFMFFWFIGE